MNLKNEEVLLSGIGSGNEFFFQGVISWVGKKWGYSLFFFFFYFLIIW